MVVSLGKPAVPNVVGMTQAAATSAITTVSLAAGTITSQYSDTVAAGFVISQNPAAETVANVGSAVDMVVSLGRPAVPNVVGMTQANATVAIAAVSLTAGTVTQQYSDTVPSGLVISQAPVAETLANIG